MAINITNGSTGVCRRRESDNKIVEIHMTANGIDSVDTEPKTNTGSVSAWHTIATPVATLTKSIYDAEFALFIASSYVDGNTVEQEVAAIIARKQASSDIDADIKACVAGHKTRVVPENFTVADLA